jgi:hypothetical protein
MSKFLFVAESDKIQDLLFRSSRLQEVIGGSQLLTAFCEEEIRDLILELGGETKISSAGSFRILFDSEQQAREFGKYLSELYRRRLGGTISITDPIKVINEKEAIEDAQINLRRIKHIGISPLSTEHVPYIAVCASCGVGIAKEYKKRYKDEKENYICNICERKAETRDQMKNGFLREFISSLQIESMDNIDFPNGADDVAKLERRNYVGYIIADVNNMGAVFSACENFEKMRSLSKALYEVLNISLAKPTRSLIENRSNGKTPGFVPVIPLILGGDDVFALVPAQQALDFALQFSREFENRMNEKLSEIGIQDRSTISVAVVICKGKFPYSTAHELGEKLLRKAKKRGKIENPSTSTISFKIITKNEIFEREKENNIFCAGFPVYTLDELEKFIDYRYRLWDLPGTRRNYLYDLFIEAEKAEDFKAFRNKMEKEINWLLGRLDKDMEDAVRDATEKLGDSSASFPHWIQKNGKYYHKFPDLLSSWDFAHRVESDFSEYEGGKE